MVIPFKPKSDNKSQLKIDIFSISFVNFKIKYNNTELKSVLNLK